MGRASLRTPPENAYEDNETVLEAMVLERTEELVQLSLELQFQADDLTESSVVDSLTDLNNRRFFTHMWVLNWEENSFKSYCTGVAPRVSFRFCVYAS